MDISHNLLTDVTLKHGMPVCPFRSSSNYRAIQAGRADWGNETGGGDKQTLAAIQCWKSMLRCGASRGVAEGQEGGCTARPPREGARKRREKRRGFKTAESWSAGADAMAALACTGNGYCCRRGGRGLKTVSRGAGQTGRPRRAPRPAHMTGGRGREGGRHRGAARTGRFQAVAKEKGEFFEGRRKKCSAAAGHG